MNYLFVNNLTVIDFTLFDARRGLVGESWIVDIELGGELDEQGMVFDFGHVKKTIKNLIDEEFDHRLIISKNEEGFSQTDNDGSLDLSWQGQLGHYRHISPESAVLVIDSPSVSQTALAKLIEQKVLSVLPSNVESVTVHLREEDIQGAYYHYSHGLKKHDGNCQRIVHGHRSRILIQQDHARKSDLEDLWASQFHNIYIATREDLSEETLIDGKAHYRFSYTANQGYFELLAPASTVYFIDTDSTVEWIAAHIADECHAKHPLSHTKVHAFEGVGKGSIAVRQNSR